MLLPLVSTVQPVRAALPRTLREPIRQLRGVGREGLGNPAASTAWQKVALAPPSALPDLLAAMDGANDYALNWLRTAIEAVEQRANHESIKLPIAALESFLRDTRHHPRARHLAFLILSRQDPAAQDRLLPAFLNDPSNDLRRDAVDRLVRTAAALAASDKARAITQFQAALSHAREADQVDGIAKRLAELGHKVDLQQVFGWVTRWHLAGPFDNTGGAGFDQPFGPELLTGTRPVAATPGESAGSGKLLVPVGAFDPNAEFQGRKGPVRWAEFVSRDDYGLVDFNKPLGSLKEVTGYAHAEFWSDQARDVEVRLGCKNGWKVWVNGALLFGRDEYHRNIEIDQYRLPVRLRKGRNDLLVKCCQNEQTEDWTKEWEFQLRITDAQGTPVRPSR